MSAEFTTEEINALRYLIRDYPETKTKLESVNGVASMQITEYDEKLTLALDNRFLKVAAKATENFASKTGLDRVETNLKKDIKINAEGIEGLDAVKIEVTGFVKGAKWLVSLLVFIIALLGYEITFNK